MPSILKVATAVKKMRVKMVHLEASPKYSHQSNADVESEHFRIESQIRCFKIQAEEHLGVKINAKSLLMDFFHGMLASTGASVKSCT